MKTQTTLEYLVKQLVIKFAEINGYEIKPYMDILKIEDPRIKVWLEMAVNISPSIEFIFE
ncbi:MAG: hypothetical protein NHB32_24810 [Fischerella sp. CENA71]|nr:hypothetical protein [Fischerella sp. CENA71]